jgi:hypothetical protein
MLPKVDILKRFALFNYVNGYEKFILYFCIFYLGMYRLRLELCFELIFSSEAKNMYPFKATVQQYEYARWTLGSIHKQIQFPFKIPTYFANLSPCSPSMLSFHLIPVCQVSVFQNVPPYMPNFSPHHSITITFDLYKALIPPYSFTSIQRCHVQKQPNIFPISGHIYIPILT